jgi:hypothetical protein
VSAGRIDCSSHKSSQVSQLLTKQSAVAAAGNKTRGLISVSCCWHNPSVSFLPGWRSYQRILMYVRCVTVCSVQKEKEIGGSGDDGQQWRRVTWCRIYGRDQGGAAVRFITRWLTTNERENATPVEWNNPFCCCPSSGFDSVPFTTSAAALLSHSIRRENQGLRFQSSRSISSKLARLWDAAAAANVFRPFCRSLYATCSKATKTVFVSFSPKPK